MENCVRAEPLGSRDRRSTAEGPGLSPTAPPAELASRVRGRLEMIAEDLDDRIRVGGPHHLVVAEEG